MEVKKYSKVDLNQYSLILFQIGLIVSMSITYFLLETKTYAHDGAGNQQALNLNYELEDDMPITEVEMTPPPPPPPPAPPQAFESLEVIENDIDIEESLIESTETSLDEGISTDEQYVPVEDVQFAEEEVIEDVPFALIEDTPVYPGCENEKGSAARKDCMSDKIKRFVTKEFDNTLGGQLGLSGIQKIYVQFRIDEKGNIVEVMSRGPHPVLEKEAKRVIEKLPKMIPGKQRGKPVRVSYSMPIVFEVRSM